MTEQKYRRIVAVSTMLLLVACTHVAPKQDFSEADFDAPFRYAEGICADHNHPSTTESVDEEGHYVYCTESAPPDHIPPAANMPPGYSCETPSPQDMRLEHLSKQDVKDGLGVMCGGPGSACRTDKDRPDNICIGFTVWLTRAQRQHMLELWKKADPHPCDQACRTKLFADAE